MNQKDRKYRYDVFFYDKRHKVRMLKIRKKFKQKGMILHWENGKLKGFRFRYFDS